MEITRDIFLDNSDLPRYEFVSRTETVKKIIKRSFLFRGLKDESLNSSSLLFNSLCDGILLIILLIYSILLSTVKTFDESNTKENYDINSLNKIFFLNKSLFILLAFLILGYFLITFFACRKCSTAYGCTKFLKIAIIMFFLLLI